MVITTREIGGVVILDIEGDITRSRPLYLHQVVKTQLNQGKDRILLNYEKMGFIDSSGVGELVSSHTSVNNLGGELRLARISDKLRLILEITGLINVFSVHDSVDAALAGFLRK